MTILLTVSPKEAVELLNGNATSLVRSWKVPLGTAYIYVGKGKPYLFDFGTEVCKTSALLAINRFFTTNDDIEHNDHPLNGLVVAKCEITECKELTNEPSYKECYDENNVKKLTGLSFDAYYDICTWQNQGHGFLVKPSSLTVFDKPMELSQFKGYGITGRYDTGVKVYGWKPITKLPSRWQEVEVGE